MDTDKIIYQLTVEDIQTVASDELDRELTEVEINAIEDSIAKNIDWYEAISSAIAEKITK